VASNRISSRIDLDDQRDSAYFGKDAGRNIHVSEGRHSTNANPYGIYDRKGISELNHKVAGSCAKRPGFAKNTLVTGRKPTNVAEKRRNNLSENGICSKAAERIGQQAMQVCSEKNKATLFNHYVGVSTIANKGAKASQRTRPSRPSESNMRMDLTLKSLPNAAFLEKESRRLYQNGRRIWYGLGYLRRPLRMLNNSVLSKVARNLRKKKPSDQVSRVHRRPVFGHPTPHRVSRRSSRDLSVAYGIVHRKLINVLRPNLVTTKAKLLRSSNDALAIRTPGVLRGFRVHSRDKLGYERGLRSSDDVSRSIRDPNRGYVSGIYSQPYTYQYPVRDAKIMAASRFLQEEEQNQVSFTSIYVNRVGHVVPKRAIYSSLGMQALNNVSDALPELPTLQTPILFKVARFSTLENKYSCVFLSLLFDQDNSPKG
jgi:hypothetical protein